METSIPQHRRARIEFERLTRAEIEEAIRGMAREGYSDHTIAAACRLAVEGIRRVLGERSERAA